MTPPLIQNNREYTLVYRTFLRANELHRRAQSNLESGIGEENYHIKIQESLFPLARRIIVEQLEVLRSIGELLA